MKTKFEHLVFGGTFDFLHKGHKSLIDFAFKNGEKITIGLTSQKMVLDFKKKKTYFTFSQRLDQLKDYLKSKNYQNFKIVKIDDLYGVAIKDKTVDGIVVSQETVSGADAINTERSRLKLSELPVIIAPTIFGNDSKKISSTRILSGEIDRAGNAYAIYLQNRNFSLPDNLRPLFNKPIGKIVTDEKTLKKILDGESEIVCVGDEVTRTLMRIGARIDLAIVDFKINRKKQISNFSDLGLSISINAIYVKNSRGTINSELINAISGYFQKSVNTKLIKVEGEEDLAVIPVILLSPPGTVIVYGQRNVGAVVVSVNENLKKRMFKLLEQFKTF